MSEYSEKLKDPRWQKLRLEVFERDEWKCFNCRSKSKTLNVHHDFYEKNKEPWEYMLGQLKTLCEDCHSEETKNRKSFENALIHALRHLATWEEVRLLANAINNLHLNKSVCYHCVFISLSNLLMNSNKLNEIINWSSEDDKISKN